MTKFVLDSGNPEEYRKLSVLAKNGGVELWGATTNPSLIAKQLTGKKLTQKEAFALQKDIVQEIVTIVPGAVSAEVYADNDTTADQMIEQGREIATWHPHVVVKLPTTYEAFKARTQLRKEKIVTNNTLVFTQEQIVAICLHEKIIQEVYGPTNDLWPPFISPFVGRLDDIKEDGMALVVNGMNSKKLFTMSLPVTTLAIWMLEASVRKPEHIKRGLLLNTELITAPFSIYETWLTMSQEERDSLDDSIYAKDLIVPTFYNPPKEILEISTIDEFMNLISSDKLSIKHELTDKGIERFVADWKAIIG